MSRVKERIPIVLNHINWYDFITYLGFDNAQEIALNCNNEKEKIEFLWMANPDLRLTQVLVIRGILPNSSGFWFYTEEVDYMIEKNIVKLEEILFWGTYGKDGKGPLKYVSLNNMDSGHIEACLKTQKNMNKLYRKTMQKILRIRKLESLKEK